MEKYPGPVIDTKFVDWNPDPVIFKIPGTDHPVVWYGLLFAVAFVGSHFVMNKIFKEEGRTPKELDRLTLYVIVGTVLGARLGHCFFYEPQFYLHNPLSIFKVWEGGLASHGGAAGILISLWLYCRKTKENLWWIFDRIVVAVAFSGICIRLGNLMNSEIVGHTTELPWGFKFIQDEIERNYHDIQNFMTIPFDAQMEFIKNIPARHPSQLYESLFCVILFVSFFFLWKKKKYIFPAGFMFGLFCVLLFTFRFLVEFTKETQVDFEKSLPIDMGQILSLPFVIAGVIIMIWAKKKHVLYAPRPVVETAEEKSKKK